MTINNRKFRDGETPTAAQLNQPYDDLAAETLREINTKPNWATRAHFNASGTKANEVFFFNNDTSTGFTTQSTSYVLVNSAGTPIRS
jgi:hypothetical protein